MGIAASTPPQFNRLETTMTKSKITAVALTALTLAGSLAANSGSTQAHSISLGHRRRHRYCRRRAARGRGYFQCLRFPSLCDSPGLPSGDRFRKCAQDPGLQLLLIRWIGACNVHPRADLEEPPGMTHSGGSLRSESDD
jgi:hypothetical protein